MKNSPLGTPKSMTSLKINWTDHDLCPWSIAFDRSEGHIIICCVWSRADYVESLVRDLATKHELDVFDPQADRLHPFDQIVQPKRPWWKLW